jgi:hypothetical protein
MTAVGAEQEKSAGGPEASRGDLKTGVSFNCTGSFPCSLIGNAIILLPSSSAGGVGIALTGFLRLADVWSLLSASTRSSYLLHLSCRYTDKHLSMIARVLSTLKGIFIDEGASRPKSLPSPLPLPRGTARSFIVKQHMHRNLSKSFGTRTRLSQHMHLRVVLPSSSSLPPACFFFPLITLPGGKGWVPKGWSRTGTSASSTSPSESPTRPKFPVLLLRPNSLGSGWEEVRLCDGLPGEGLSPVEEAGMGSGTRGSGLLELDLELEVALELLPRRAVWLLEDPARMRDGHVGGMAAAARHRSPLGVAVVVRVMGADQELQAIIEAMMVWFSASKESPCSSKVRARCTSLAADL